MRKNLFLSDPGVPGVRSMGPDVHTRGFADLTEEILADEDTNSIQTDTANRAIQGNVTMQVMQVIEPSGQLWNQCKWHQQITNKSSGIWGPNLKRCK